MLQAKYPILDSKEFLEIIIGTPEIDPKSRKNINYFCNCKISAPNYKEDFNVHGIDPMQSTWLALRHIRTKIIDFEKKTKVKCQYCYFNLNFEK